MTVNQCFDSSFNTATRNGDHGTAAAIKALREQVEQCPTHIISPDRRSTTGEGWMLWCLEAELERDELRAWKESALAVEREWDAQAIATMLGATLGESCRKVIAREVPKLIEERDRLTRELAEATSWIETLKRLDKSTSPCGHNQQFAWSPDGVGKVIICLRCAYDALRSQLEQKDAKLKQCEADLAAPADWRERIPAELKKWKDMEVALEQKDREAASLREALEYGWERRKLLMEAERSKSTGDNWDFWNYQIEKQQATLSTSAGKGWVRREVLERLVETINLTLHPANQRDYLKLAVAAAQAELAKE